MRKMLQDLSHRRTPRSLRLRRDSGCETRNRILRRLALMRTRNQPAELHFVFFCRWFLVSGSCFGGFGLVAARPQHPSAGPKALHPSQKFNFCSYECFDTCRPGGQPKVFPLDPLILFGVSTLQENSQPEFSFILVGEKWWHREKRSRECRGRTIRFALCPASAGKNGKPKFQISAMGAGPMVLPRGVGGEQPPTKKPPKQEPETGSKAGERR